MCYCFLALSNNATTPDRIYSAWRALCVAYDVICLANFDTCLNFISGETKYKWIQNRKQFVRHICWTKYFGRPQFHCQVKRKFQLLGQDKNEIIHTIQISQTKLFQSEPHWDCRQYVSTNMMIVTDNNKISDYM